MITNTSANSTRTACPFSPKFKEHNTAGKTYNVVLFLSKDYKKDILSILADGVELSHETGQLQRIGQITPVNCTLKNV